MMKFKRYTRLLTFLGICTCIFAHPQANTAGANTAIESNMTDTVSTFNETYAITAVSYKYDSLPETEGPTVSSQAKNRIILLPDAATRGTTIIYKASENGDATINILDIKGKSLLRQDAHLSKGKNQIVLNNFNALQEGSYAIQLTDNKKTYTSRCLVWK